VHEHIYFPSHLFFWGEWRWVEVTTTQLVTAAVVALDASWDLPMGWVSCGRAAPVHMWQRPVSILTPARPAPRAAVSCDHLCLHQCPAADLKLVQTKRHDKLGVGVTEESHNKLSYEIPMGGQGPSKHREGKADRDKGQGGRTGEGVCE
jgi:hypothetical protein